MTKKKKEKGRTSTLSTFFVCDPRREIAHCPLL